MSGFTLRTTDSPCTHCDCSKFITHLFTGESRINSRIIVFDLHPITQLLIFIHLLQLSEAHIMNDIYTKYPGILPPPGLCAVSSPSSSNCTTPTLSSVAAVSATSSVSQLPPGNFEGNPLCESSVVNNNFPFGYNMPPTSQLNMMDPQSMAMAMTLFMSQGGAANNNNNNNNSQIPPPLSQGLTLLLFTVCFLHCNLYFP